MSFDGDSARLAYGLDSLIVGAQFLDCLIAGIAGPAPHNVAEGHIGHPRRRGHGSDISSGLPREIHPDDSDDVHAASIRESVDFAIPAVSHKTVAARADNAGVAPGPTIERILQANVRSLMDRAHARRRAAGTIHGLARVAGCGVGTVQTILAASASTRVDIVDRIAGAFGLRAYQLLIEGLDPVAPARLPVTTEEKKALRIALLATQMQNLEEGSGDEEEETGGVAHRVANRAGAGRGAGHSDQRTRKKPSRSRRPA